MGLGWGLTHVSTHKCKYHVVKARIRLEANCVFNFHLNMQLPPKHKLLILPILEPWIF